jgi:hypothetical protein
MIRVVTLGAVLVGLLGISTPAEPLALPAPTQVTAKRNIIQEENTKTGSSDWQLTRVKLDKGLTSFRTSLIEGFCSHQSVKAGGTLQIMVSTAPAAKFKIEIFRTGYYQGRGARLMTTLGPLQGKTQPVPPVGERRLRECQWEPSASLKIPADWTSGVYVGRLTTLPEKDTDPYWQSYVVFVVRDDRPADVLFQCSDNTWQAYNRWPDNYSIYTDPKGTQGPWSDVSFDRPYAKYAQIYDNPMSIGSGEWLCFEFPLAYWLEQHGYDVSYCSNSDMITAERGLNCKAFLSVGHDEYWDLRAYNSAVKLRDAGVSLLFLSGNAVCWVSPLKPSSNGRPNRILFRGGPYGGQNKWAGEREKKHGPFPERGPDEGYLIGARNVDPVNGGGDWICTKADHWIFKGTGMKHGDRIPGLVGWEYHGDPPKDLVGLEVIAEGTAWVGGTRAQQWTATIYSGPKSNFVFNASTIFWSQGLSSPPGHMLPWSHWSRPHGPDERVQRITENVLKRALGRN